MLPLQVRADLGAMAMKGYATFPKAPTLLKPHHQKQYQKNKKKGDLSGKNGNENDTVKKTDRENRNGESIHPYISVCNEILKENVHLCSSTNE